MFVQLVEVDAPVAVVAGLAAVGEHPLPLHFLAAGEGLVGVVDDRRDPHRGEAEAADVAGVVHDAFEVAGPFENPDSDRLRYTDQMRHIRDVYKNTYKDKTVNTLLFFVVPGFVNPRLEGYMVKIKSLGFVVQNDLQK